MRQYKNDEIRNKIPYVYLMAGGLNAKSDLWPPRGRTKKSSIVKTFSLQLLVDFAEADPSLRPEIMPLLWEALERGTPAMRARAHKLVKKYKL